MLEETSEINFWIRQDILTRTANDQKINKVKCHVQIGCGFTHHKI